MDEALSEEVRVEAHSEKFKKLLEECTGKRVEEKLRLFLDLMRESISQESLPNFRDFWEGKRVVLSLFKESLPPRVRTPLWSEYIELAETFRKLKVMIDEQSAYAEEQIQLAIDGIEEEIGQFSQRLSKVASIEIPDSLLPLEKHRAAYINMQKELSLLNPLAIRINDLRSELIQLSIRVRAKNHFFQRLSKVGDQVFSRRKEAIKELSALFIEDIVAYAKGFQFDAAPSYSLKEEIKAMQSLAKELSINSGTFHQARHLLSDCWEKVKEKESTLRDERKQRREQSIEHLGRLRPKIDELEKGVETNALPLSEAEKKVSELLEEAKEAGLEKDEVRSLQTRLIQILRPLQERMEAQRKELIEKEKQEQIQKSERRLQYTEELETLLARIEALSIEMLEEKWTILVKEGNGLFAEGIQRELCEIQLAALSDAIWAKKWAAHLIGQAGDFTAEIHSFLEGRLKEKRKIRQHLEALRKMVGGSSLSLEDSLRYGELIQEEKNRLEALEIIIEEIEEKLFETEI